MAGRLSGLNKNDNKFKQARLDLWIASAGDYLVKLELKATGKSTMMGDAVDGKLGFSFGYSDINKKVDIALPKPARM